MAGARADDRLVCAAKVRADAWTQAPAEQRRPAARQSRQAPPERCRAATRRQGPGLPRLPRRRGQEGVAAPGQGAGRARSAHRARSGHARRLLPGACALGRGGVLDRALRHDGQVAERLPDAESLCRGRQQAGRHHGPHRRRARHDPELPHPDPGRRKGARRTRSRSFLQRRG